MVSWTARALNRREIGAGPAVLVLDSGLARGQVSGAPESGAQEYWAPHLERLAAYFRVITYDLACSKAADPDFFDMRRHFEIDGHVGDLLAVLEESRVHSCTVIGHGVCGMIGLLAAAERPELIGKLIMVGSSPCYLNRGDYRGGLDDRMVDDAFFAVAQDYRTWIRNYTAGACGAAADHPTTVNLAGRLISMRPDCALATAKMLLLGDYRARLDGIAVPTVILQLPGDPAVPIAAAHYLHDHLRNSILEVLDANGASCPVAAPALLEAALRRHLGLDALPGAARAVPALDPVLLH